MKIRLVGTELFMRTDRYTDMTKLIVVFRNFANAPKNCHEILPITTLN
jgi:Fe-S-cluster formation regulator IscX/YfhJ